MKPSEIIKLARRQTGCTEDIVTTEEAYKFLNFIIEDFGADIRNSDSGYGFDIETINVSAGQSTYTFTNSEGDLSGKFPLHKIQAVWLYDGNNKKWRDLPVHFVDKVDLNKRESVKEPLACFITRDSVNLIPTPKESTEMQIWGFNYNTELINNTVQFHPNNWSYVTFVRNPSEDVTGHTYNYAWTNINGSPIAWYTDTETPKIGTRIYNDPDNTMQVWAEIDNIVDREENIWIPARWHYIIVEGLKYRMYGNMGVNFETARNNSRAFYDSEKIKAIQNIVDRGQLADTAYFPDLNFLNY